MGGSVTLSAEGALYAISGAKGAGSHKGSGGSTDGTDGSADPAMADTLSTEVAGMVWPDGGSGVQIGAGNYAAAAASRSGGI